MSKAEKRGKIYFCLGFLFLQIGACLIHIGLTLMILGAWIMVCSYFEYVDIDKEDSEL